ncbi:MAG: hypothetical protein E6G38_05090 [Actinobacteria bacterium]|nr:MAG: hypothetical protein E6G38_05090 [Actinomycetota bacterium]
MTVDACGRQQSFRSLLHVEGAKRLLAVRNALRPGIGVDSAQEIATGRFVPGRGSIWFAVFCDHNKAPLRVDALDRFERQQAPTPDEDPVSTDRQPLSARVRIVDQLDDQPDPSAAEVEHRVAVRLPE